VESLNLRLPHFAHFGHIYIAILYLTAGLVVAVGIALLALVKLASASTSIVGRFWPRRRQMSITCKWGKERIQLTLPSDPDAPLKVLRDAIADHTGLEADRFKMVHSGAVMKNDSVPLSTYRIKPNSTIAIIGTLTGPSASGPERVPPTSSQVAASATEQSTLNTIRSELETVRTTLKPSVDRFLESLEHSQPLSSTTTDSTPLLNRDDPKQSHRVLGELLLQSLLRLDAITPEGEWVEVRSARKGAVREIQGLLDRLDEGWRASFHS